MCVLYVFFNFIMDANERSRLASFTNHYGVHVATIYSMCFIVFAVVVLSFTQIQQKPLHFNVVMR